MVCAPIRRASRRFPGRCAAARRAFPVRSDQWGGLATSPFTDSTRHKILLFPFRREASERLISACAHRPETWYGRKSAPRQNSPRGPVRPSLRLPALPPLARIENCLRSTGKSSEQGVSLSCAMARQAQSICTEYNIAPTRWIPLACGNGFGHPAVESRDVSSLSPAPATNCAP